MDSAEFVRLRGWLGKTQEAMSQLLGISVRAVHSYEQGWRSVPPHVERQVLFLVSRKMYGTRKQSPCWKVLSCDREIRKSCPAWEYRIGDLCWFISGTNCKGAVQICWEEKMELCRECVMMRPLLEPNDQE